MFTKVPVRNKPSAPYCGLTIVLDKASRHDVKDKLISGYAGSTFEGFLAPINRNQCDIRTIDCNEYFLPNTKVVLLLGEEALRKHKNKEDFLNDWRGCPWVENNIIYIASYAPQDAHDRRNYDTDEEENTSNENEATAKAHEKTTRKNYKFWLYRDTAKAIRILTKGIKEIPSFRYTLYPQLATVTSYLNNGRGQTLFIDLETDAEQTITCVGLSFLNETKGLEDNHPIYVIPFKRYNNTLAYSKDELLDFFVALDAVFRSTSIIVAHNGARFDWFVLSFRYKLAFPRNPYDTLLAQHRLYPEIEKSLGHIISFYTDLPYHKGEGVFDPKNQQQEQDLWKYNGKDISSMMLCYIEQQKEITRLHCEASVAQANASIRPYLTMMYKGILLDVEKLLERFDIAEQRVEVLERALTIITGRELNPRSPKQVAEYLYDYLGFEQPDEEPTNKKNLYKLLVHQVAKGEDLPSLRILIQARKESKLAGSLKFRLWNNNYDSISEGSNQLNSGIYNRATTCYLIGGTDTFRPSSQAILRFRPDPGYGTNIQNWDKVKRYLCIADAKKLLGQSDQSGADALVYSYLCRRGNFRKLFENRIKPHNYIALKVFENQWRNIFDSQVVKDACTTKIEDLPKLSGWKELQEFVASSDDWPGEKRYYYIGKKLIHAFDYGMKAPTMSQQIITETAGLVVIPERACNVFLGMMNELLPEVVEHQQEVEDEIKRTRVLHNLFGYARRFHQPHSEELWRAGYIFNPQSTVATITNVAITELQNEIENGNKILNENHFDILQMGFDSILWQADDNENILSVAKLVQTSLAKQFKSPVDGAIFTMGSSTGIGKNWGPFDTNKNPFGLKNVKL